MTILVPDNVISGDQPLLVALLAGERFWPTEPQSVAETGLPLFFLTTHDFISFLRLVPLSQQ